MRKLIEPHLFKKKYNISQEAFLQANIEWNELESIYEDYKSKRDGLLPTAKSIVEVLLPLQHVHSVKYRIKDPEHLIEKIIRKRCEGKDIVLDNYLQEVTDIIGIRILHLFKEEWSGIHDFIAGEWTLNGRPEANVRYGDSESLIEKYKEKGCGITVHKAGYRSVHYLITSNLNKKQCITEVQVRTIFEEAWSEIDHRVRYPYNTKNKVLLEYLEIFNRLSGSADEMGSYINRLSKNLGEKEMTYEEKLIDKDKQISELHSEIERLKRQRLDLHNMASKRRRKISFGIRDEGEFLPSELTLRNLTIHNLSIYINESHNAKKLEDIALDAGFDMESIGSETRQKEWLAELMLYLKAINIRGIKDLDKLIENNLLDVGAYYIDLVSEINSKWVSNIFFSVILLLIMVYPETFDYAKLHDELGWDAGIASKVSKVANRWVNNKNSL